MEFRKITAIIRQEMLEAVETRLQEMGVSGVTVSQVKGYGEYANFYTRDWLVKHVRIETFIGRARADEIVEGIMEAAHGSIPGDGIVAVQPVEKVYRIRTRAVVSPKYL
ncbi:MAG TPA: P-II family nitrogen regulator [Acidiferrobacteraceae bacterium]|nr:P-II family nitrogen regulator [Acidiferrobacteraceae bacterium]